MSALLLSLSFLLSTHTTKAADTWQAGAASVVITPEKLMWMSGYGNRDKPAEGKLHDLWAKALVLEDGDRNRAVLVSLDVVGIDRQVSLAICSELEKKYGLKRSQVALNCSHTHCGPVVGRNLGAMFFFGEDQWKLVDEYTATLQQKIVAVVGEAIGKLQPATIGWDIGYAGFAVNRRENKQPDVPGLRETGRLKGPIDHDVPVLSVRDAQGKLLAIAFGYACHATVLDFYQWCGDYPGFAQIELEKSYPGTVALFWAGCGADQNPVPRRTVELAELYGRRLAQAVDEVIASPQRPVSGSLQTSYAEIELPLDKLPTREQLKTDQASTNRYIAQRARLLAERIDAGLPLSPTYPYPIQVWQLGPDLRWVTLGGEVVVDYALRLKQELGPRTTWMAGYTNDVMAYIPSRRVLLEGGYEGATAMIYYGLPTSWAPDVEELIVREVHRQAK
jgi:hypothetical protein